MNKTDTPLWRRKVALSTWEFCHLAKKPIDEGLSITDWYRVDPKDPGGPSIPNGAL